MNVVAAIFMLIFCYCVMAFVVVVVIHNDAEEDRGHGYGYGLDEVDEFKAGMLWPITVTRWWYTWIRQTIKKGRY